MLVSGGGVGGPEAGVCSAWASRGSPAESTLCGLEASGRLGRWWPRAASFEAGGRGVARGELVRLELKVFSSRLSAQAGGSGSAGRRSWGRGGAFAVAPSRGQQSHFWCLSAAGPGSPFAPGRVYACPSSQDGVPPSSQGLSDRGDVVMLHLSVRSQVPECSSHAEPRVRAGVSGELAETRVSPPWAVLSLRFVTKHPIGEVRDAEARGARPGAAQGSEVQPCSAREASRIFSPTCARCGPGTARPGRLGSESPLAGPRFSLANLQVSASENPSPHGIHFSVAVGAVLGDSKVVSRPRWPF